MGDYVGDSYHYAKFHDTITPLPLPFAPSPPPKKYAKCASSDSASFLVLLSAYS